MKVYRVRRLTCPSCAQRQSVRWPEGGPEPFCPNCGPIDWLALPSLPAFPAPLEPCFYRMGDNGMLVPVVACDEDDDEFGCCPCCGCEDDE